MMKFNIKYFKIGNLFFFASNLSEWNSYCRKNYNKLWLKNNPLNQEEQEAVEKLRDILKQKKYKLADPLLTVSSENEFRENISKILSKNQTSDLTKSVDVLSKRFEKIWLREEKNLKKIQKKLIKDLSISNELIVLIKKLYKIKKLPKSVNIFLFTNPIKKRIISGGSGFGAKGIGVECSQITKDNNKNNQLSRVIMHELIHAYFEKRIIDKINKYISSEYFKTNYQKLIFESKIYKQVKNIMGPIKELILVSLLPEGYLAKKFFGLNIISNLRERRRIRAKKLAKNYYDLMLFGVFKMRDIAKNYSDNQKSIDKNYIEKTIECWIKFENTDLKKLKI